MRALAATASSIDPAANMLPVSVGYVTSWFTAPASSRANPLPMAPPSRKVVPDCHASAATVASSQPAPICSMTKAVQAPRAPPSTRCCSSSAANHAATAPCAASQNDSSGCPGVTGFSATINSSAAAAPSNPRSHAWATTVA